jgi:hypothetical protein
VSANRPGSPPTALPLEGQATLVTGGWTAQ